METGTRPQSLTVNRGEGILDVVWADGHHSAYSLRWLRANCPCATCREERRAAVMEAAADMLKLNSGPLPSTEIAGAELVGNYAVRFDWSDGHATGIYAFGALRHSCPCAACNPEGPPPLLPDD
jgi:DUF971 family protein